MWKTKNGRNVYAFSKRWVENGIQKANSSITLSQARRLKVLHLINLCTHTWKQDMVHHFFSFQDAQSVLAMETIIE